MEESAPSVPIARPTRLSLRYLSFSLYIILPLVGFLVGFKLNKASYCFKAGSSSPNANMPASPSVSPSPKVSLNLPSEVNNTTLYFKKDGRLFKISPLSSTPAIFLEKVSDYAFSPDKKRLAYTKGYGPEAGRDNDIAVLNLQDSQTLAIPCKEPCFSRGVSWSPKGNYLLVDSGTGPIGEITVYNSVTGKKLSSFDDMKMFWQDDRTVYKTAVSVTNPGRPWGGGEGTSLAKVDIVTGNHEFIKNAGALVDYHILNLSKNCLYYKKNQVTEQAEWNYNEKIVSQSYCYSLSTKSSQEVSEALAKAPEELLREKILLAYPQLKNDDRNQISEILENSAVPGWVVFSIYHESSANNSDIVIANLNNPSQPWQKLATGAQLSWH